MGIAGSREVGVGQGPRPLAASEDASPGGEGGRERRREGGWEGGHVH